MLITLAVPVTIVLAAGTLLGVVETVVLVLVLAVTLSICLLVLQLYLRRILPQRQQGTVAFFHPNANGGGGGERVLWCAIQAVQQAFPAAKVVLFSSEELSDEEHRSAALSRFNLSVKPGLQVIHITGRHLLLPEQYPRFTLVGQATGSVRLAFQALRKLNPEVFVDTSGWAFTSPLARLAGARVACYVHYPTISTDMLSRVYNRTPLYNNSNDIASSLPKSLVKLAYYYLFACAYGMAGGCAQAVMVNSSWTWDHIHSLWWSLAPPHCIYPPCDTAALQQLPLDRKLKRLYLVSVAQFRPEKNHLLQLQAFAQARMHARTLPPALGEAVLAAQLRLVGSSRGPADDARVQELKRACQALDLEGRVEFRINIPYAELQQQLGAAVGGLHTMVDEHFGISVVEYMAAGVIPIAHNSGGPKQDIVGGQASLYGAGERVGYLCSDVDDYADSIVELLAMDQLARLRIAEAARKYGRWALHDCQL